MANTTAGGVVVLTRPPAVLAHPNRSAGAGEGPVVLDADHRARLEEQLAQLLATLAREAPPSRRWPCDTCRTAQPFAALQVVAGRLLCPTCANPTAEGATAPAAAPTE